MSRGLPALFERCHRSETHAKVLGKLLYTEYLFPFEIASLILLVAVVGAVVLAKRKLRSS